MFSRFGRLVNSFCYNVIEARDIVAYLKAWSIKSDPRVQTDCAKWYAVLHRVCDLSSMNVISIHHHHNRSTLAYLHCAKLHSVL